MRRRFEIRCTTDGINLGPHGGPGIAIRMAVAYPESETVRQSTPALCVILPLAGEGERFAKRGYRMPKPLVPVLGRPMILRVIESLDLRSDDHLQIVHHSSLQEAGISALITSTFPNLDVVLQNLERRTGGAAETVLYGLNGLSETVLDRPVLVVDGDGIFDADVVQHFRSRPGNTVFCIDDPGDEPIYSYLVPDADGVVRRIAEKERISTLACIGAYGFEDGRLLRAQVLRTLGSARRLDGEHYLSHVVQGLIDDGGKVKAETVREWACLGTPAQLRAWSRRQILLRQLGRLCLPETSSPSCTLRMIEDIAPAW